MKRLTVLALLLGTIGCSNPLRPTDTANPAVAPSAGAALLHIDSVGTDETGQFHVEIYCDSGATSYPHFVASLNLASVNDKITNNTVWDFGDGTRALGGTSQAHTFRVPGWYTITVYVSALVEGTVWRASRPCTIYGGDDY